MSGRTDLEDLDLLIHRRGTCYLAKIPQVGLYATGHSLPEAIEALERKKKDLLEELVAADALNEISVTPPGNLRPLKMLPALALFTCKALIVLALILFTAGIARHIIQRDAQRGLDQLHQFTTIGGAQFWAALEEDLEAAASPAKEMPSDKKRQLLADIRIIVDRWRPFVKEASRLFYEPTSDTPKSQ